VVSDGEDYMKKIYLAAAISLGASPAFAEVCDYTPSNLIGGTGTGVAAGGAAATAATGVGMKAACFYTAINAVNGATMLGSTAAGASAAGTTGFIAGTAGLIGTAEAVVMSPVVIVGAAVTAAGVGIYEGAC
jgi:hypothetical protein